MINVSVPRTLTAASLLAAVVLAGCSTGGGPENMNETDLKKAVDSATPQQQIDWYKRSPMPASDKAKKIAEIEEKYHVKDSGGKSSAAGAPSGG